MTPRVVIGYRPKSGRPVDAEGNLELVFDYAPAAPRQRAAAAPVTVPPRQPGLAL